MKKNYFLILIVLGFYSCQKEISTEVSNTNTSTQVDVYVAGFMSDDANNHYPSINHYYDDNDHPTYWKNGSPVRLNYGDFFGADDFKAGRANTIAVSGNNVHVAGYGTVNSYFYGAVHYAMFWKDDIGADLNLLPGADELSSLVVSNNDIYI